MFNLFQKKEEKISKEEQEILDRKQYTYKCKKCGKEIYKKEDKFFIVKKEIKDYYQEIDLENEYYCEKCKLDYDVEYFSGTRINTETKKIIRIDEEFDNECSDFIFLYLREEKAEDGKINIIYTNYGELVHYNVIGESSWDNKNRSIYNFISRKLKEGYKITILDLKNFKIAMQK